MKLAVALMVKNEEKIIERCLESVKEIADIIIISDTGCMDETPELIKKFCEINKIQYEINRCEWKNFGLNRTELLSLAKDKSDYVLLIDADMVVELNNFDKNKLSADAYFLKYSGDLDYSQILLVNNKLNWKYFGATHEYIASREEKSREILETIKIKHLYDGENRKDKFLRDIELLLEEIKSEPENARSYFYLANSYRDISEDRRAIAAYEKRIALGGWAEEIFYSMYQMGLCAERLKCPLIAKQNYLDAFEYRPTRAEPLYRLSVLCRNENKWQQAYMYAKKGLEISYPEDILFIDKNIYDYYLLFEKSISSYYVGEYSESYNDCNTLLSKSYVPENIKQQVRENIKFSKEKLNL